MLYMVLSFILFPSNPADKEATTYAPSFFFFGQVTQLDMTMKEHKSELQQKVITLEHALNQARYELSERAVEVINTCSKQFFI